MNDEHELDPQAASARIAQLERRAGRRARWPGWLFLAIAVVNAGLFVVIASADRSAARALSLVPALLVVVIVGVAARQPVIARDSRQINRPVLVAAIATNVAGLVLDQTVLPQHFTGWLVVLAIAMQSPLLVGAWLWLRR
jgi:hypothetical protein